MSSLFRKTALSTGRNIKLRRAPVTLSLFSFATSACSNNSIVRDGTSGCVMHCRSHSTVWNFQREPRHPQMPALHFYKWALSVETAQSHPHHAERDAVARDIIKVPPKHSGSVCIPVTGAIIHKHKQMFFMWSRVSLLTSAVVYNTVCVNQRLQRWRRYPFVILWFVFLRWHPALHSLPGVMRNVLSAPNRRGAFHSMEGCHENMLKPAQKTCPRMMIYSHKRELLT